ncbi:MAG: SMP-30/gluconolactonase/LRE family protein [Verrucomicrobia bacterium]|nr:SMP-30/gluconolactonase/LRE family protein [Verrucomicrobiota bacterium]
MYRMIHLTLVTLGIGLGTLLAPSQRATAATRQGEEDVNSLALRYRAGLLPSTNLLFNGWGVTPAGSHVPVSDMPLKLVVAPDQKAVIVVCAGYNNVGLHIISLAEPHKAQFIPLKEVFNGLVFSRDGKRFYVSGGDKAVIYVFKYTGGVAELEKEVEPNKEGILEFLAGLAIHPGTGVIYVCNEANHEVWALDPTTLKLDKAISVGQHPHSCMIGADKRHLYVSNWGSRSVSVIDLKYHRRLRDITVGIRPTDMALAPDGRLFVACAGDNTVHVISTAKLEKPGAEPSPARRLWEGTREIISTSLYAQSPEGSTPGAVTVSPDGKTLFVANADNNNVMPSRRITGSCWWATARGWPRGRAGRPKAPRPTRGTPAFLTIIQGVPCRGTSLSSLVQTRNRWEPTRSRCGAIHRITPST